MEYARPQELYFVDKETHPLRMYRALRQGGKWRVLESTDGATWIESDAQFPLLQISARAFATRAEALDYFERWREAHDQRFGK
jgi:hypothetical protein